MLLASNITFKIYTPEFTNMTIPGKSPCFNRKYVFIHGGLFNCHVSFWGDTGYMLVLRVILRHTKGPKNTSWIGTNPAGLPGCGFLVTTRMTTETSLGEDGILHLKICHNGILGWQMPKEKYLFSLESLNNHLLCQHLVHHPTETTIKEIDVWVTPGLPKNGKRSAVRRGCD